MTDRPASSPQPAPPLLPEGLRDRLPPAAEAAARINRAILDVLASHGYARVAPALAEFRETLDGSSDDALAAAGLGRDLLRFTDPVSQRTIAIRPDITTQIGRIAISRMADAPRPLRLCYSGQVVKLRASQLRPEREMLQVGAELIGKDSVAAACEIAQIAVEAVDRCGAGTVTVDLTLPDLVFALAEEAWPLPAPLAEKVRARLDAKDAGGLAALGPDAARYLPLITATGSFDAAFARLRTLDGGAALAQRLDGLAAVAAALSKRARVTLDPTERHGFEYQSWFGFSLFVAGQSDAIGRGGSYRLRHGDGRHEAATGFSLYPDPLIDAGLGQPARSERRIFMPLGSAAADGAQLRADGWITLGQLAPDDDAATLGCTHIWSHGVATPL